MHVRRHRCPKWTPGSRINTVEASALTTHGPHVVGHRLAGAHRPVGYLAGAQRRHYLLPIPSATMPT